ncbi:MAG: MBL fold metallo-hydrolase [bacterium]|nr:MBL fold metallo-hydrolase [bacterium]
MLKTKQFKWLLAIVTLPICAGIIGFLYLYPANFNLIVTFLDVGQGDSALIQTPYGQNILIDAGDVDGKVLGALAQFLPFYDRELDLVIISHPHEDHIGGLEKILQRYDVKKILYTGVAHTAEIYLQTLNEIKYQNIPVVIIERPQTINLGQAANLEIIYPRESLQNKEVSELNNSSIVFKLTYGENAFLFAGDAEAEVEDELLRAGADLSADVFKASHHGSDTSNTAEFLQAVDPEFVVISVGKDNSFGHPAPRVLTRLERMGISVYRTDEDGSVQMAGDGKEINVFLDQ